MCNLYNITTSQEAIRQWARALRDILGNLEPSIDIYPNQPGPVVRNAPDGEREVASLLWGMPTPPERVKGKADCGTTNIRNPQYGYWQQYVGVDHRRDACDGLRRAQPRAWGPGPRDSIHINYWFALNERIDHCSS
ncbi:hypothetical protein NKJ70_05880 [Mesorhizobium sp. M0092]|uniref:hypothetical protein n=1 Tax=Mesorhizobium sp. M0092 TaxID=2956876 RepID=UPI0033364246